MGQAHPHVRDPSTGLTDCRFYGSIMLVVLDGELAVPCTRKPP